MKNYFMFYHVNGTVNFVNGGGTMDIPMFLMIITNAIQVLNYIMEIAIQSFQAIYFENLLNQIEFNLIALINLLIDCQGLTLTILFLKKYFNFVIDFRICFVYLYYL